MKYTICEIHNWGKIGIGFCSRGIMKIEFKPDTKFEDSRSYSSILDKFVMELEKYFSGAKITFTTPFIIPLLPEFSAKVLYLTSKIPYGKVVTYKDIAEKIGSPNAYRAVGNALNKNPLPIIIPCHRVISSNNIGGFSAGIEIKKSLLKLEGAIENQKA